LSMSDILSQLQSFRGGCRDKIMHGHLLALTWRVDADQVLRSKRQMAQMRRERA
jgi:hypothetical protein